MYREFFKIKKRPFHITPEPDFLFLSPSHKEACASIYYGVQGRKGFVAIIGEVGVGKTTVLRSYLDGTDPEKIKIVYLFNAALSFNRLLRQVCSDLGITAEAEDPDQLLNLLLHHLIDEYSKDRNVVLIIDEAQNMAVETLERLRMLSNLETSRDKLIQIVLVGQPEFEAKLNRPELRQLKQRIAVRSRIEPLSADESIVYIQHRLMLASSFYNPVFSKKALQRIVKAAEGIPRQINILCDNALVTAFGYLRKPVDESIIKEVIRDFRGPSGSSLGRSKLWVSAAVARFAEAFYFLQGIVSGLGNHAARKTALQGKIGAAVAGVQSVVYNWFKAKSAPAAGEGDSVSQAALGEVALRQLSANDRVAGGQASGPGSAGVSPAGSSERTRM